MPHLPLPCLDPPTRRLNRRSFSAGRSIHEIGEEKKRFFFEETWAINESSRHRRRATPAIAWFVREWRSSAATRAANSNRAPLNSPESADSKRTQGFEFGVILCGLEVSGPGAGLNGVVCFESGVTACLFKVLESGCGALSGVVCFDIKSPFFDSLGRQSHSAGFR
jgi:hypothetical protein